MSKYISKKKILKSLSKAIEEETAVFSILDAEKGYISIEWVDENGAGEFLVNHTSVHMKFGEKLNYVMYTPLSELDKA